MTLSATPPLDVLTPPAVTITVVICCYSAARRTQVDAAVVAAAGQLRPGDHLVVVVDHNEALRADLVDAHGDRAEIVANTEARGLSGARNSGVRAARGDVVVFR